MTTVKLMVSGSRVWVDELEAIHRLKAHPDFSQLEWCMDDEVLTVWMPPEARAAYWVSQLENLSYDFYWLVRGGEGTSDMMPYFHAYKKRLQQLPPRCILGMSDATPLLIYCAEHLGWPSVHVGNAIGLTMPDRFDAASIKKLSTFLIEQQTPNILHDLMPLNESAAAMARLEGCICVGNLSLLNISIGDVWEFDARDNILMIEDWHEKGYVVDRTLKYLKRIGKLEGIQALVFGDFFYEMEDAAQRDYLQRVLQRFAANLSVPVFQTDQFGHGQKQTPLVFHQPFAATCRIG